MSSTILNMIMIKMPYNEDEGIYSFTCDRDDDNGKTGNGIDEVRDNGDSTKEMMMIKPRVRELIKSEQT